MVSNIKKLYTYPLFYLSTLVCTGCHKTEYNVGNPVKVNSADQCYDYASLYVAAKNGKAVILQTILLNNPGIDVNKADEEGNTPLCLAAKNNCSNVTTLLLKSIGIKLNKADKVGNTPLYLAAKRGHVAVVEALLASPGIDVNRADLIGCTPLNLAAFNANWLDPLAFSS